MRFITFCGFTRIQSTLARCSISAATVTATKSEKQATAFAFDPYEAKFTAALRGFPAIARISCCRLYRPIAVYIGECASEIGQILKICRYCMKFRSFEIRRIIIMGHHQHGMCL